MALIRQKAVAVIVHTIGDISSSSSSPTMVWLLKSQLKVEASKLWSIRHLASRRQQESTSHRKVSTDTGLTFWRAWGFAKPLFYHFDLIWWMARAEECQSQRSSFNHQKLPLPIMRIEMREWLFPFKYDQVSSQLLRCAGLSKMKHNQKLDLHHIFWSNRNEIKD